MNQNDIQWEKEFDKKWVSEWCLYGCLTCKTLEPCEDHIKQFIRETLHSHSLAVQERVEKMKRDLERSENTAVNTDPAVAFNHGYNTALDDLKASLGGDI